MCGHPDSLSKSPKRNSFIHMISGHFHGNQSPSTSKNRNIIIVEWSFLFRNGAKIKHTQKRHPMLFSGLKSDCNSLVPFLSQLIKFGRHQATSLSFDKGLINKFNRLSKYN